MKNKLFYLISVACFLSYTGTFTSCVNGVDDEYLEQKITDDGEDNKKGEELPDLNGDYSIEGDFDLELTCNGEVLNGKKVLLSVDENNETASFTFAAAQTDLETAIATAIPGGVGGLVSGWGLKYTGNSPVPGQKEIIVANVPLYRNGPENYIFEGENIEPTYAMTFKGKIEGEKMTVDVNYELTNQKLAGTWYRADMSQSGAISNHAPLWIDWKTDNQLDLSAVYSGLKGTPNTIFGTLDSFLFSETVMNLLIGKKIKFNQVIYNLLEYVAAEPNGSMYASYSYNPDIAVAGPYSTKDTYNVLRYYYDLEKPDERIYLELNSDFLINMIGSLGTTLTRSTRADDGDLRDKAKALIKLLVPVLEQGIPCEYTLDGEKLIINIDGIVLKDILTKLAIVANDPDANSYIDGALTSLGDTKPIIMQLIKDLPTTLGDNCEYVKLGFRFVRK